MKVKFTSTIACVATFYDFVYIGQNKTFRSFVDKSSNLLGSIVLRRVSFVFTGELKELSTDTLFK